MYVDFEIVLVNQSECVPKKKRNTKKKSWTKKIYCHFLCCVSLHIKSSDNCIFRKPKIFREENSVAQFLDAVMASTNEIQNTLKKDPHETAYPVTRTRLH